MCARHLGDNGVAYDLGCSLGATTLAILSQNQSEHIFIHGIDSSEAMITGAKGLIRDPRCAFTLQDIRQTNVLDADVVVLNLVLQFIDPTDRLTILKNIREQMKDNGIVVVSEKVSNSDSELHNLYDQTPFGLETSQRL